MNENKLEEKVKQLRSDPNKFIELLEDIYDIKLYYFQKILIKRLWKNKS